MRYSLKLKMIGLSCLLIIGLFLISFNYIFINRTIIKQGTVTNAGEDMGSEQRHQTRGYGDMELTIETEEGQTTLLTNYDRRLQSGTEVRCVNRQLRFFDKILERFKGFKFTCKDKNSMIAYI